MTKKEGTPDALQLAQEALKQTDKDKSPKLYKAREDSVKALENYREQEKRAQQAEQKAKEKYEKQSATGEGTPTIPKEKDIPKKSEYSLQDIRALSDVHDDDVEEVVDYAKSKGISIAEAKKTSMIQSFLKDTIEERKVADATNTGKTKQGSSKGKGKSLLKNAKEKGELPDSDADMEKLVNAEFDAQIKK